MSSVTGSANIPSGSRLSLSVVVVVTGEGLVINQKTIQCGKAV